MDRRTFFSAAGALSTLPTALLLPQIVRAADDAKAADGINARKVWRDMTQKELDDAYTQSVYAPNAAQINRRYAVRSRYTRSILGDPERFGYGRIDGFRKDEGLELFHPAANAATRNASPAPVVLFVHGGAWKAGRATDYNFLAEPFVRDGFAFALADFPPVQAFDGDLAKMARSLRRTFVWLFRHAKELNIDPARIYLVGHSSGAHLAAVLLATDFKSENLPADLIKAGVLVSGLYDLEPVRLSVRSSYVHLTDASEEALSPIRHLKNINAPLLIAWGTLETPEFLRQSKDFSEALRSAGKPVKTLLMQECNHFEGIETLADPYSPLARAALALFTELRA